MQVWSWWCLLHERRSAGFSPNPISYTDIEAFQRLEGVTLAPWELKAIVALDNAWLVKSDEQRGSGKQNDGPKMIPATVGNLKKLSAAMKLGSRKRR